MQAATACGVPMQIELLGYNSLITRSRNPLVARFLDTPGASHLLFVDADIGFEVAQVARMLQLGEDLVAGMYPLKLIDWDPGALARAHAGEPVEPPRSATSAPRARARIGGSRTASSPASMRGPASCYCAAPR